MVQKLSNLQVLLIIYFNLDNNVQMYKQYLIMYKLFLVIFLRKIFITKRIIPIYISKSKL